MLKAGVKQEIITPTVGTLLAGYPQERVSSRVKDELTLTAISVSDENTKAILISACLLNISNDFAKTVRDKIKEIYGIENVILCATHTHSGPIVNTTAGWGSANSEYLDKILFPKLMSAVKGAVESEKDAVVGIGCSISEVGINRRRINEEGKIGLGENPWGIIDKRMYVIAFKTVDGEPICNIIHYGAHGTCAGGADDPYITRDWSGVMVDRLADYTGAVTAFFNAAEGDIAPRMLYNSKNREAQLAELGSKGGYDAIEAYRNIKEFKSAVVKGMTAEVKLPYEELPALETAKAELKKFEGEEVIGMRLLEIDKWKQVIKAYETDERETHLSFTQNIVSIGEIAFVPFPFEHFTEISMRLDHYSPFGYTLSLSNANGSNGYLPCRTEICRGGYEIWSFKFKGAYGMADNTDDTIIKENLSILREMKK